MPATSSTYGPSVRRPLSVSGTRTNAAAAAVVRRIPAGIQAGRSKSAPQPVGAEAGVAHAPALRALAHVLAELLGVERLHRAVLALDSRHHERFSVAGGDGREGGFLGQRQELHADATVRPFG